MPGFAIHLSVAKEIVRLLSESSLAQWSDRDIDEFYIGNILPDVKKTKKLSHYWGGKQMNYILRIPDLDKFLKDYSSRLLDKQFLGYYCHLNVDKFFYEEFLPETVCFLDRSNKSTNLIKVAEYVYLYKKDMTVAYQEFWTSRYYYGDFDILNVLLQRTYGIDAGKIVKRVGERTCRMNPGQWLHLQRELKKYLGRRRAGELKVFLEEDIESFIIEAAQRFFEQYKILRNGG